MPADSRDPSVLARPSVGLEVECAVAARAGGHTYDARAVFGRWQHYRGEHCVPGTDVHAGDLLIGSTCDTGFFSVDNGFNNLEYAFAPVGSQFGHTDGSFLNRLAGTVCTEMNAVLAALHDEGAVVLNLSEHPDTAIDADVYHRLRAPKPIYTHWVGDRGWRHEEGIDAKAQNGPSTGVDAAGAVQALNLMLWTAPAMIALFGNSPFEAGRVTGLLENRLTLWPRMFANAHAAGDRRFHLPPARPFRDLSDYLMWMYGPGTTMQVIPANDGTYKGYGALFCVEDAPCLLDFLSGPARRARHIGTTAVDMLCPQAGHISQQQFAHFLDARIRFQFAKTPALPDFFDALHTRGAMEQLFSDCGADVYIEGRACGANFPDQELLGLADAHIAASVVMAPTALQKGLLCRPGAWSRLSSLAPWSLLPALRDAAIRDGLDGRAGAVSVRCLTEHVLDEAAAGLAPEEQWMLAYPRHVVRTGRNGAQRALHRFQALGGSSIDRIRHIATERAAHPLPALPPEVTLQ